MTAIRESWALLKEALESKFVSGGADGAAAKAVAVAANSEKSALAVAINPDHFPLLLSLRVYELVVGGLAANLMEVEVRSGRGGQEGGSDSLELCPIHGGSKR